MTSLLTAKILFFIAMSMNPPGTQSVFATSNSENFLWSESGQSSWTVETKGLPTCDWEPMGTTDGGLGGADAQAIAHHDWKHNTFLNLENGNRVEKQGDAVFYIISPGAPNQKVYTILYPGAHSRY